MSDDFLIIRGDVPHHRSVRLPAYTAQDTPNHSFEDGIAATPNLSLPVLTAASPRSPEGSSYDAATLLARDICSAFHSAIAANQDDVVAHFVSRGYISPDAPNQYGETPLLAAVRCGHVGMVRILVALGALVDLYGQSATVIYEHDEPGATHFQRTPQQYAAERGHLAMVKVLMEECGADDSLVAPDGGLALRLAAENGHREVVDYLPVRRGGGWKRWKTRHEVQMRRTAKACRRIGTFMSDVFVAPPMLVFWYIPKWVCENRFRIGGWMKKQFMKIPKYTWEGVKAVPKVCQRAAKATWQILCGVPTVLAIMYKWLQYGVVTVSSAIANGAKKLASMLHTAVSALVSFFHRITVGDVWRGLVAAAQSTFIDLPKAILDFMAGAGEVVYQGLGFLLGELGACVYYSGLGLLWLIIYLPKR